ncbi:hypothetical protein EXIGLDRAFT_780732 [Exidia glandulosa HHB12029]|uniref:DUF6534 domain-containing protein n=1 Tax=Exidia glandulosa HHB12029 TaxID=1314781 RepID=A0A165BGU1_EXIGL|nr:hypothetical protein EXIGLDRAFT_780732 [Exidia glandulosa HHB12029]
MDSTIPPPSVLAKSLGPWLIGPIADLILMGTVAHMVADYWSRYRDSDNKVYKTLVLLTLIFNVLKSCQACGMIWWKFVTHFGDYVTVTATSPWEVQMDPTIAGTYRLLSFVRCALDPFNAEICNFLAQLFFVTRLYRLIGGLRWLFVPLVPAMLLGLVGHILMTIRGFNLKTVDDLEVFQDVMYVGLVGVLAADMIITASMSWYLLNSRTGFSRTDNLILRILHTTWVTAAMPSLAELLNLVLYLALVPKGNNIFLLFSYLSPKLYGVSMMYTLNSRESLRSSGDTYAMNSRLERMTGGISVTRDIVRVTDAADSHPPKSIHFAASAAESTNAKEDYGIDRDSTKAQEI